ncbi:hypothetical protein ABGB07_28875 [Micromonosporaceae bacterium B7E4]
MAFTWFAEDEANCVQRDYVVPVDAAWTAVQTVTSPHVETVEGTPLRRYRIGPAAKRGRSIARTSFCTTMRYV